MSESSTSIEISNTEEYPLLSTIDSPADLRRLPIERLPEVCAELRKFIIRHLSNNPGHFASSMGAVEIIVALHYVFDTPSDRLVWDVGHQAYAHKILTGRRDAFAHQRTHHGISGFPTPLESEYDTFVSGHAGNSISAALGMAIADKNTPGRETSKTVAVIGDASISCGLAFEGLNNASNSPNDLLIILNDNDMSIDNNVGALHKYLSRLTTSESYNRWRNKLYKFFKKKGYIDDTKKGRLLRLNNSLKAFISKQQNIFEGLNIRYFGPFDGHDVIGIVKTLQEIKNMSGPRLLHLHTTKGKGYANAEKDPTTWHAPGKFDINTGERLKKSSANTPLAWQDVFGKTLVEIAEKDPRVVGITAAMPTGTSISHLQKSMPERAFDTGISEGHAVTFAGGLAAAGKRPFVAIYSSFLQRAYDNIIHDIAIQGLPVTFCLDRAGLVGEDGVTHHGLFDMTYLRCVPGMKIAVPADEETLRNLMFSSLSWSSPLAIRYPRGTAVSPEWKTDFSIIEQGVGRKIIRNEKSRIAILALGPMVHEAKKAIEQLKSKDIDVDLYDMIWLKPLDKKILDSAFDSYSHIITLEDGSMTGGFGSAVSEYLSSGNKTAHSDSSSDGKPSPRLYMMGIPDKWIGHGTVSELRQDCGISADDIVAKIEQISTGK